MRRAGLMVVLVLVAACAPVASSPARTATPADSPPASVGATATAIAVFRSPTCTCCHEWEDYLQANGFVVHSTTVDDIAAVKMEHGLPRSVWSCHTAIVDGYVVEGHVPVEAINDLLSERPAIDAIALPGMPAGSPGMTGQKAGPFGILSIADGEIGMFGAY